MKTEIVIPFDPKDFDTASDMLASLYTQFSAYLEKRYIDLYYQTTFPFDGLSVKFTMPVEAPAKKQPQKVVMPVENEDGETLLPTFNV